MNTWKVIGVGVASVAVGVMAGCVIGMMLSARMSAPRSQQVIR